MKFGFIPTEGGLFYPEFIEEVTRGETLGFDSVWLEEHHGVIDHYWPSPLIGLAGIATRTERLTIGTNILILPLYHPVRVAEDSAMLSIMSGGRFILGVAIGYKPDDFGLYQVPLERRGARFEEAIRLIRQLWTQTDVYFPGKYYHVEGFQIQPRPVTQPPIWIGGWGELSLSRAARLGDAWIPGPTANIDKLIKAQSIYMNELTSANIDLTSMTRPLTREIVIANTDEEAWQIAEKHLLISYRDEYGGGEWKHPLIGGEDTAPIDQFSMLSQDRFLVGNPETIILQIQRFITAFGVDHLIFRLFFPGLPHKFIMEELDLLGHEVLPALR
jgi:alkanesulfonate monooxygenase SsuD/methylene tetrahydromethanopterin reductase-like flavin-dependent oxidoreductase (luciferase family)